MGSTQSKHISSVEAFKNPRGDVQSALYWTPDGKNCAVRVEVGKNSANVSLLDNTFRRAETRVDLTVHDETKTGHGGLTGTGAGGIGAVDVSYDGSYYRVCNEAAQFNIGYGDPSLRCGGLVASIHDTGTTQGDALMVTHFYASTERIVASVVVRVWFDGRKGCFACSLTGPTRHSKLHDSTLAVKKAYPPNVMITRFDSLMRAMQGVYKAEAEAASKPQTTKNTALINNPGTQYGILNGAIINIYPIFLATRAMIKAIMGPAKKKRAIKGAR